MKNAFCFITMIFYLIYITGCSLVNQTNVATATAIAPQAKSVEPRETIQPSNTVMAKPSVLLPTDTPSPSKKALPATIQFLEIQNDLGGIAWMEKGAVEYGVDFLGCGIYAFDKDSALLYGGIDTTYGPLQSTILRTKDGGKTWVEVMKPVLGSLVVSVSFMDGGTGWALVVWYVESVGEMVLYQSDDYGDSWRKLSDVPKWQWYGYPIKMKFTDLKNGQIDMMYDGGLPSTNRVGFLTTSDGGVNWQETDNFPLQRNVQINAREDMATSVATYFSKYPKPNLRTSQDKDGGYWQLEEDKRDSYRLTHRVIDGEVITYAIPSHFSYQKGKIVPP